MDILDCDLGRYEVKIVGQKFRGLQPTKCPESNLLPIYRGSGFPLVVKVQSASGLLLDRTKSMSAFDSVSIEKWHRNASERKGEQRLMLTSFLTA